MRSLCQTAVIFAQLRLTGSEKSGLPSSLSPLISATVCCGGTFLRLDMENLRRLDVKNRLSFCSPPNPASSARARAPGRGGGGLGSREAAGRTVKHGGARGPQRVEVGGLQGGQGAAGVGRREGQSAPRPPAHLPRKPVVRYPNACAPSSRAAAGEIFQRCRPRRRQQVLQRNGRQ